MPKKRCKRIEDEDFSHLFFGKSDNAKFRHKLYNQTWQQIEAKMKELQKQVFDTVVSEIIKFCQKNFAAAAGQQRPAADQDVLPTCALVTGVNLPDHKDFFRLLGRTIKKSTTKHVATVKSSDCTTVKLLVKRILTQLQKQVSYYSHNISSLHELVQGVQKTSVI